MSKKTKVSSGSYGDFRGFFNYQLTESDKAAIRGVAHEDESVLSCMWDLLSSGYKLSLSKPKDGSTYFFTAIGREEDNPNHNRAFTVRHVQLGVAVVAAWHVIDTVYDYGEWPDEQEDPYDW